jgi:capsule polysaccharide export protein KpsE/RkpR
MAVLVLFWSWWQSLLAQVFFISLWLLRINIRPKLVSPFAHLLKTARQTMLTPKFSKCGSATQDAYVVTSFIHSTEILRRMGTYLNYKSAYTLADADFLSRFDSEASQEKFLQYWRKMVSAYIDGPSGIVTLQVNSFRPEDSVTLANSQS